MKTCTKCKESKDESLFSKRADTKSGHRADCKECAAQRVKKYDKSHLDTSRERNRKWVEEHPEDAKASRRKWAREHPERIKVYNRRCRHKRRVKLANSPFPKEFKLMSHCWVCLSTKDLCVDHIIPVSRGGTNDISNLTTLCRSCNASKGKKTYTKWFEQRLQQSRSEIGNTIGKQTC